MHSLLAIHAQTKNQQNNEQNDAKKITTSESQENLRHQSIQRIAENCGTGVLSENCDGDSKTERERARKRLRVVTVEDALIQESWRQLHHSMA